MHRHHLDRVGYKSDVAAVHAEEERAVVGPREDVEEWVVSEEAQRRRARASQHHHHACAHTHLYSSSRTGGVVGW